jgi:hypothetical protein
MPGTTTSANDWLGFPRPACVDERPEDPFEGVRGAKRARGETFLGRRSRDASGRTQGRT